MAAGDTGRTGPARATQITGKHSPATTLDAPCVTVAAGKTNTNPERRRGCGDYATRPCQSDGDRGRQRETAASNGDPRPFSRPCVPYPGHVTAPALLAASRLVLVGGRLVVGSWEWRALAWRGAPLTFPIRPAGQLCPLQRECILSSSRLRVTTTPKADAKNGIVYSVDFSPRKCEVVTSTNLRPISFLETHFK